jgi:Zn-dependent protease with chaperone function
MKQVRFVLLLWLFAIALPTILTAQTRPANSTAPSTLSLPSGETVTQPSPDIILEYSPPPAEYARAKARSIANYRHFFVNTLCGLLVLLVVLRWRVAPSFRNLAERASSRRSVQIIIFGPLMLLTIAVLGIPSDIWDHSLDLAFGRSLQSWPAWLTDWITNEIVVLIVGTVLVAILYAVIRRSPRRWWFYFWTAAIPLLLVVFFLKPLVIDPLFFTFKPLAAAQPLLVSEIQKVTHRAGIEIPSDRLFIMNASSKQTGMNAYIAGFGASKRVVISDNTIAKATMPAILFVFGHETGHYVLWHIPKETAIISTIILVLLFAGYHLALWMLARWGAQWGIRYLGDLASFPALFFLASLLVFFAMPAFNAESRYFEHEADRYGLEVIHGIVANPNQVAAHYFERSGEMNLSEPDPNWFTKAWFWDHPPYSERVHFVATYDPWSKGEEPTYVK